MFFFFFRQRAAYEIRLSLGGSEMCMGGSPSGEPMQAHTVEEAGCTIGRTFSALGALDPCLSSFGQQDFCLQRTWMAWGKEDPPANCVKPIPVTVLHQVMQIANNSPRSCHEWHQQHDLPSFFSVAIWRIYQQQVRDYPLLSPWRHPVPLSG